jgi:nucleoid-associated protein YgaU
MAVATQHGRSSLSGVLTGRYAQSESQIGEPNGVTRRKGGVMATTNEPSGGSWDATQWHEVKKGETLWKIAEHYYGDGSLHTKIFEANRDTLKDPNLIQVGQRLRIP